MTDKKTELFLKIPQEAKNLVTELACGGHLDGGTLAGVKERLVSIRDYIDKALKEANK